MVNRIWLMLAFSAGRRKKQGGPLRLAMLHGSFIYRSHPLEIR
jgi:hypothetical protein